MMRLTGFICRRNKTSASGFAPDLMDNRIKRSPVGRSGLSTGVPSLNALIEHRRPGAPLKSRPREVSNGRQAISRQAVGHLPCLPFQDCNPSVPQAISR